MILTKTILINNPNGNANIDIYSCKLSFSRIVNNEEIKDLEVRDIDLYNQDQYFSKAPRLRRIITTKEIDLSPPPKQEGDKEMPLILTIGPMMTMGVVSLVMFINTLAKIQSGTSTMQQSWPQLATSGAMLLSMILWPTLTKLFNRKYKEQKKQELIEKYSKYLADKETELIQETKFQKEILVENLLSLENCLPIR